MGKEATYVQRQHKWTFQCVLPQMNFKSFTLKSNKHCPLSAHFNVNVVWLESRYIMMKLINIIVSHAFKGCTNNIHQVLK